MFESSCRAFRGTIGWLGCLSGIIVWSVSMTLPGIGAADASESHFIQEKHGRAADEPSLPDLVERYLETTDPRQADRLAEQILAHPQATLDSLKRILRDRGSSRSFDPEAPVGIQPSVFIRVGDHRYSYGLWVPESYDPHKAYPLVICLHGAGFTGDMYLDRWQPRLGERYILACPTLPQGAWWTKEAEALVLATMEAVTNRYRVDPDRIFLTGMSNGGIGTYMVGVQYAPLFAGLAPMAGGLDEVLYPLLANLGHTPVYIIHGSADQIMPVELSRDIVKELKRLGYAVVYREHDRTHPMAGGHFFPREELPPLINWLDHQKRPRYPHRLTVVRDATHLIRFDWIRIDATDRIAVITDPFTEPPGEALRNRIYARLDARIVSPHRIEVETTHVRRYTLYLDDALVDLSQPVTIVTNGRVSHQGLVTPNRSVLLREARLRQERDGLYSARLTLAVGEDP